MVQLLADKEFLDNLEEIEKIDKGKMLSFCTNVADHYVKAAEIAEKFTVKYPRPKIVAVAGMGGSAIGGEQLKDWMWDRQKIPVEVCHEYSLPAYINKNSLIFIASYSGDTEETLSAFVEALKRRSMIVCISSGGLLLHLARKMKIPYIKVPEGIPPRAAFPYLYVPILIILEKLGIISNVKEEISEAIEVVRKVASENSPHKPLCENFSKKLASEIKDTVPVVYGFGFYRSVAQRFKQQFNENGKIISKWEVFPELNHNEIVGWESAEKLAVHFSVIFIRDVDEPMEIRHRIEATKEILHEKRVKVLEVWSIGKGKLAKMLSTTTIGDFTSIYLALLRKIDPTPVETINFLKNRLAKAGLVERLMSQLQNTKK
ncbi:MAG: bifunctional phosphoglucose/phosphomannose isomerase [Candidatus Bathyarchaeia archaeon]